MPSSGIIYSPKEFTGTDFSEIFMETLYQNETVSENKVRLITDIKAATVITEMDVQVVTQAYTCNVPETAGTININDGLLTPCKAMTYQEWCPDDLRFSRFSTGMRSGAWETINEEWLRIVMETYGTRLSRIIEAEFWNGASTATAVAVAGLTPGSLNTEVSTEEQAYVAAAPNTLCDGVATYLIYNNGAVGKRIKVVGTTITASNIDSQYALVYAAIPSVLLKAANVRETKIFAPESHLQLINIFNNAQLYRDTFTTDGAGGYYYLGVKIEFVPLAENVMIAGRYSNLIWGTDLTADYGMIEVNRVALNADKRFFKAVYTMGATAVNQAQMVLYVG